MRLHTVLDPSHRDRRLRWHLRFCDALSGTKDWTLVLHGLASLSPVALNPFILHLDPSCNTQNLTIFSRKIFAFFFDLKQIQSLLCVLIYIHIYIHIYVFLCAYFTTKKLPHSPILGRYGNFFAIIYHFAASTLFQPKFPKPLVMHRFFPRQVAQHLFKLPNKFLPMSHPLQYVE